MLGDLLAGKLFIGPEPARHPVDRTHKEEHRHLRIHRANTAVGDAVLDQLSEMLVELVAAFGDDASVFRIKRIELAQHGSSAHLVGHELDVLASKHGNAFKPVAAVLLAIFQCPVAEILSVHVALEQNLLLVLDVVVQSRLGHAKGLGDIVERGGVIALGAEGARSLTQQRCAFKRELLLAAENNVFPGQGMATAPHVSFLQSASGWKWTRTIPIYLPDPRDVNLFRPLVDTLTLG